MLLTVDHVRTEKSGKLIYRRKYPKHLTRFIASASPTGRGPELFKVSLRTRSMNEPGAMTRYQAAQSKFEAIVANAERARAAEQKRLDGVFDTLDDRVIARLASLIVNDSLMIDQELRLLPEPSERKRQRAARLAEVSAADLKDCRELRAVGDIEAIIAMWGDHALGVAEMEGMYVDPASPPFAALCNAVNDAQIVAWEGILGRLKGDLIPTPPVLELPLVRPHAGVSLLALFDQYAAVPGRSPKTMAQWRPYIAHLVAFVGREDVQAISHDDLVAWRNHLRDNETYRGKPLSAKTINGSYLGAVQALYAWAKGDGLVSHNPALEVTKVKLPAQPMTRGKAFTTDEAAAVLRAALECSTSREGPDLRNAKRWCPWLMAYSGARVNEVTQLRKEDIFEQDGVWVMRITPDAGTVKTKIYRLVPLHSHLRDQGFLEFVRSRPPGPLFYDPSKRRTDNAINRQANVLGSKVAAWVRTLGIEGVKPNHAWRHLFINLAVRHGLDARVAKAITGHASSDVQDKVYLADLVTHVDVLSRELEKLPRFLETASEPR